MSHIITIHKKEEVKMRFKSYHCVFKNTNCDFLLYFTLSKMDLKRLSERLYSEVYAYNVKSKNKPYDPTSLLRLMFIYYFYFSNNRFFTNADIHKIPDSYLRLCGFDLNILPSHSTYYYFLNRIGINRKLFFLNQFKVLLLKFQFRLFTCRFTKKNGRFIVFAADSKPVEADGKIPKGTIYSNNQRLNGKLGFKIHSISIVYPFFFPVVFKFTPGHHSDSTVFKELFPLLKPLLDELSLQGILTFLTADSGYDGLENTSIVTSLNVIPCIAINKRNNKSTNNNSDMLFTQDDKIFCINNPEKPLHSNGSEHKKLRHQYRCYYYKNCPKSSACSKRFWLHTSPDYLSNESLLLSKLRLEINSSEMYHFIYTFRIRIETIHGIWNTAFMLENKFYFHNFKELLRFELKIVSYSFYHFLLDSKASVKNYFY